MASTAQLIEFLAAGLTDPDTGIVYSGAIVVTYAPGTSNAKVVWSDRGKTLPTGAGESQFNLDSNGQVIRFGDGVYDIKVYDPEDTGLTTPRMTFSNVEFFTHTYRGCLVYRAGNQTIGTGAATQITWDSEDYDTEAIHSTVSNTSRLTVPTGVTKVKIWAEIAWASNATGIRIAEIYKNGSATYVGYASCDKNAVNGGVTKHNITTHPLTVVAGDYFEITVLQSSGGDLTVTGGSTAGSSAGMEIIE